MRFATAERIDREAPLGRAWHGRVRNCFHPAIVGQEPELYQPDVVLAAGGIVGPYDLRRPHDPPAVDVEHVDPEMNAPQL
ncbi:MAG: hypothetical protein IPP16_11680 [Acidimicrobiaceae bacterium]|nr:hypothetical protein [Acidimicrobiaceae bacterium]